MHNKFLQPNWPAPGNVHAYSTTRQAGNLATYILNDLAGVLKNREQIKDELNLPGEPCWLKQMHTTQVISANHNLADPVADASFTQDKNIICAVLTADCLPILLCNTKGTIVAAVHAGWRGLADGIIEATYDAMHCNSAEILAWFGPAIGPEAFLVAEDVRQKFIEHDPKAATAFTNKKLDLQKWYANLYALARQRLNALGINKIFGGGFCTYNQTNLFFSYRREKEAAGRMASLIWLD